MKGKDIKAYRASLGMTQEAACEAVRALRQTPLRDGSVMKASRVGRDARVSIPRIRDRARSRFDRRDCRTTEKSYAESSEG